MLAEPETGGNARTRFIWKSHAYAEDTLVRCRLGRGRGRSGPTLSAFSSRASIFRFTQKIIAALDVGRFHWIDTVPPAVRGLGLVSIATVFAVWYWAMRSNPFFSAAVRVQHDRGHYVVSSGPYRFVRHPGYSVLVLLGWGGGVALGSWAAAVPHAALVALSARVRYRLIPGVW
jgi:protein-S-isoprenylcysteine O-methyltransferase Ste14